MTAPMLASPVGMLVAIAILGVGLGSPLLLVVILRPFWICCGN